MWRLVCCPTEPSAVAFRVLHHLQLNPRFFPCFDEIVTNWQWSRSSTLAGRLLELFARVPSARSNKWKTVFERPLGSKRSAAFTGVVIYCSPATKRQHWLQILARPTGYGVPHVSSFKFRRLENCSHICLIGWWDNLNSVQAIF